MKEIRQSKSYAEYLKTEGWIVDKAGKDFVFIKKLPFIGSLIKYQRPEKPDLNSLLEIARKHKSIYIVAELKKDSDLVNFKKGGFRKIKPFLPASTLILNLDRNIEDIFKSFDKDARYSIRKTEKNIIREENNIDNFYKNWINSAAKGRYILTPNQLKNYKKSFKKDMILLSNKDGSSGAMFLIAKNVGYYWYGFTSDKSRASLIQYKIIFEGIKWAKKRGAKQFDFEGIYDERFPDKAWLGFSVFKSKFGGKKLKYPEPIAKWMLRNIF